tara:strand:- start:881 stop:1549 length:669 start_codon:yes stop_codon:yes gene_type:complete
VDLVLITFLTERNTSTFNQTELEAIAARVGEFTDIDPEDVEIEVLPTGEIQVTIPCGNSSDATAVARALTDALGTVAGATAVLGVTVTSPPTIEHTTIYHASPPSIPPPWSPPPSPPGLDASASAISSSDDSGANLKVLIPVAIGAAILVFGGGALYLWYRSRAALNPDDSGVASAFLFQPKKPGQQPAQPATDAADPGQTVQNKSGKFVPSFKTGSSFSFK